MHRRLRDIVAVAAIVLLASCTGSSDEPRPDPEPVDDGAGAQAAWSFDLDVIGQPVAADGVALVLARAPQQTLEVVALDAISGERLWSRPWSPGGIPSGYPLEPAIFADSDGAALTVFSVPPENTAGEEAARWSQPVAVLELRSGSERHRTEPVRLVTPIVPCGEGHDACFGVESSGGVSARRLDLVTGGIADDGNGPPQHARTIGESGLFATGDRPDEQIGVRRDGAVLWSASVEDLMGRQATTDSGWSFAYDERTDSYTGWLRTPLAPEQQRRLREGQRFTSDAAGYLLAAFEGATGRVLWRDEGAIHSCLGEATARWTGPRIRCRMSGAGKGRRGPRRRP